MPAVPLTAVAYMVGVAIALWRIDGSPLTRVVIALLWPVGLAALAVTVGILLVAAIPLFPWFGAALILAAGAISWWLRAP